MFSPATSFLVLMVLLLAAGMLVSRLLRGLGQPYSARSVMTPNEVEFFRRLNLAHRPGLVFPQVAMGALLESKQKGRAGLAAFRRISQKRVDYTVHAEDLTLICVVELDDRTHDPRKDAERDRLLRSVGIRTLRWNSFPRPSVAEIRNRINELRLQQRSPS